MSGKLWPQKPEAAGHMVSKLRKQGETDAGVPLTVMPAHGTVPPTVRVAFPPQGTQPPNSRRHAQRFASWVTLDSASSNPHTLYLDRENKGLDGSS